MDRAASSRTGSAVRLGGVALAAGAVFALIATQVGRAPTRLDRRAFDFLASTPGSTVVRGVKLLVAAGPPAAALFLICLLVALGRRRRWTAAAVIVAGYPLVALAAHLTKAALARPRPSPGLIVAGGYSFPSAQAALSIGLVPVAAAVAGLVGRRVERLAIIAAGSLIVLIGVLLIAVGVHYLTDVLAGWALGVSLFAACGAATLAFDAARRRRIGRPS